MQGKRKVLMIRMAWFVGFLFMAGGVTAGAEEQPVQENAEPASQAQDVPAEVAPPPSDGIVHISGEPAGALVMLGERSLGLTPLTAEAVPTGQQTFAISKTFYSTATLSIDVVSQEVVRLPYNLARGDGTISVLSNPANAVVVIDGTRVPGTTPLTLASYAAGEHNIEVHHADAYYQGQFTLQHGEKVVLRPQLVAGRRVKFEAQWYLPTDLFDAAQSDLQANRLTRPEGRNALDKYRALQGQGAAATSVATPVVTPVVIRATQAIAELAEQLSQQVLATADQHPDKAQALLTTLQEKIPEFDTSLLQQTLAQQAEKKQQKQQQAAAERLRQAYIDAITKVRQLIERSEFAAAEAALVALTQAHPEGADNEALQLALNTARQAYETGISRYSGPLIKITRDKESFQIMQFEVSVDQWQQCAAVGICDNRAAQQAGLPVTQVSHYAVVNQFIPWLNQQMGQRFRLPTEQEWLQASDYGSARYPWGDQASAEHANGPDRFGWRDAFPQLAPVQSLLPNALGVHNLQGNVAEWLADCADDRCTRRYVKGGSWKAAAKFMQRDQRLVYSDRDAADDIGFRLVLD